MRLLVNRIQEKIISNIIRYTYELRFESVNFEIRFGKSYAYVRMSIKH